MNYLITTVLVLLNMPGYIRSAKTLLVILTKYRMLKLVELKKICLEKGFAVNCHRTKCAMYF